MSDDLPTPPPPPTPPGGGAGELIPINIEDEMRQSRISTTRCPSSSVARSPTCVTASSRCTAASSTRCRTRGCCTTGSTASAPRVVGEVLGKYHPHGDARVYDALVRLAQPWNMRYLLVDGQGNFGSRRRRLGRRPMRYTEVRHGASSPRRCSPTSTRRPSTSGPTSTTPRSEPLVLPTRFPNLLVNGAAGIAVGMATNIPPHNMRRGHRRHAAPHRQPEGDRPRADAASSPVRTSRPAAFILGREGIRAAYETGRGQITAPRPARDRDLEQGRARGASSSREIPYQVNKARLIEKIAELVRDKKIEGISRDPRRVGPRAACASSSS